MQDTIRERKERYFIVLASFFIGSMAVLNIIGLTRFMQLGPFSIAVGVLPYPLTFLCTDIISEFYGKARANWLVTIGLVLNIFILTLMAVGDAIPSVAPELQPSWQTFYLARNTLLADGTVASGHVELYHALFTCSQGAMLASMVGYLAAQYCDVHLYHFWRKLTRGKHLWLRNNGSTLVSQLIDSLCVVSVTFAMAVYRGEMSVDTLISLIISNYLFKACAALFDTPFMYGAVWFFKRRGIEAVH